MSDMTAAAAKAIRERHRKLVESFTEEVAAATERTGERRERWKRARKRAAAARWLWCSFGRHRVERHMFVREQFDTAAVCVECQIQIAESLGRSIEVPVVSEAVERMARLRQLEKEQRKVIQSMTGKRYQPADGLVYYMRMNGRIKIGYTTNLRKRSKHYPPATELLAAEPGTRELEKKRHDQFSRSLAQGREWFAETGPLIAHIADLAATYGVPTELMYRHSKHEGIKHV